MTQNPSTSRPHRDHGVPPRVRPRLVWVGTAVALLGLGLAGIGIAGEAAWWGWGGAGLTVVGVVVMWCGGAVRDVHVSTPTGELGQAVEGETRPGVAPGQEVDDPEAHARAAELAARTRALIDESQGRPAPVRPIGILLLLVLGSWLVVDLAALGYPYSEAGQDAALRDLGAAVVLILSAIWLRQVGPSRAVTGLCFLCGVGLVLAGVFLSHDTLRVQWNQIVSGALVLVATALAWWS